MNSRYNHDMRLSTLMRFLSFGTELLLPGSNIHNHKFVSSFSRQHGHSSDWEKYLNTKRRGLEYIKKGMCVMILSFTRKSQACSLVFSLCHSASSQMWSCHLQHLQKENELYFFPSYLVTILHQ